MASTFAWLDFSDKERREALEVIDLFREEDTRDELGLGVIRDTFADLLFPGTSTIQTRARYFLFVPWLLKDLEDRRTHASDWSRRARNQQGRLRDSLIAGGEESGVIGYRAGLHVQRLPHSVYWQGLRRWGILRFQGSEEEYRRRLNLTYRRHGRSQRADDEEPIEDGWGPNWDPYLPPKPDDLLKATTFALESHEADYMVHRIATRTTDSLLHHLIEIKALVSEESMFVWEHIDPDELPHPLRSHVEHARNFSESMHGAPLLYNLMLAEEKGDDERVDRYRTWLASWWGMLQVRRSAMSSWDRHDFWETVRGAGGRVSPQTRQFVLDWWNLAFAANRIETLMASSHARELIADRERRLKRARARIGNPRALELWNGAAGTAQLDYRWSRPVKALLNDILEPLVEGTTEHVGTR